MFTRPIGIKLIAHGRPILRSWTIRMLVLSAFMNVWSCLGQNAISTGSLTGSIQDSTSRAMPAATIALTDESKGIRWTAASNSNGVYLISGLTPGTYRAQVSVTGFKTAEITDIKISVGRTTNADIVMTPGEVR